MGINRVKGIVRICENCGQDYHPWRADRPSYFCSNECAAASGRTGAKRKWPDLICEKCGTVFRSKAKGPRQRFCSWKCWRSTEIKTVMPDGYIRVYAPDEPGAYSSGQIPEHRLVMQRVLGRPLERHETVHHVNGDRADNRPENLQLRNGRHGKGVVRVCLDCGSQNIGEQKLSG